MTVTRHFSEKAVESLAAFIEAGLPAKLRTVETEVGLGVQGLEDPASVLRGQDEAFGRSPLVEVWEETLASGEPGDETASVGCMIGFAFTGDGDLVAGQLNLRRYQTAMLKLLQGDRTLSGTVAGSIEGTFRISSVKTSDSKIYHTFTVPVAVELYEP
jgi:hypothetical protein